MANQPLPNVGIQNSWSFISFCKTHGKPALGNFEHVDEETGEVRKFKSLALTNPEDGSVCFVGFSSKLGELTKEEIKARKDELQVVQREGSHSFILCARGANAWEDIDIDF